MGRSRAPGTRVKVGPVIQGRLRSFSLVLLWAWPSALFVPAITGVDTQVTRVTSVVLTLGISGLLIGTCVVIAKGRIPLATLKRATAITTGSALALVVAYLIMVNVGVLSGLGGDRGQALDISLDRLLAGQYPYSALTYDGGRITPLPGAFLLVLPSYLLTGTSAYAFTYLIPITLYLVHRVDPRGSAIFALAIFAAPAFWADVLSEGDLVVTSVFVIAVAAFVIDIALKTGRVPVLASLLLGMAATTRVTSLVVVFIAAAILLGNRRPKDAGVVAFLALTVFAALSLPLYLIDPAEFSPLHTSKFISGPSGVILAVLLTLGILAALARRQRSPWPATSQLVLSASLFSVGVTAIPLMIAFSDTTLFASGYAVMALSAPLAVITRP